MKGIRARPGQGHASPARLALFVAWLGCQPRPAPPASVSDVSLIGPDGASWSVREHLRAATLTVFVFFAKDCPVQTAHDRRLIELDRRYRSRGVQLVLVDSETSASPASSLEQARSRGYPIPILIDRPARLADDLGAEYATFSVVVDPRGRVLYRGGIDRDRVRLRPETPSLLGQALDDLLAGAATPSVATTSALGCALRKR
jgi:hypothetical protein